MDQNQGVSQADLDVAIMLAGVDEIAKDAILLREANGSSARIRVLMEIGREAEWLSMKVRAFLQDYK